MTATKILCASTVAAAIALIAGAGTTHGATMIPHRATYTLSAAPGAKKKDADVVDGLMVFELSDDCDGHTMTDRTVLILTDEGGNDITLESQYSAWESKDGVRFRFLSTFRLDGRDVETIRGSAKLDEPGGPGVVTYVSPEPKKMQLPKGTLFPVQAGVDSLTRIENGERHLSYILFDGSGTDGANFATDFVVERPMTVAAKPEGAVSLLDSPSWRVRTAVFDLNDETAPPITELDGQTHANGVISGFTLESDSFVALATLKKLEALPESGC